MGNSRGLGSLERIHQTLQHLSLQIFHRIYQITFENPTPNPETLSCSSSSFCPWSATMRTILLLFLLMWRTMKRRVRRTISKRWRRIISSLFVPLRPCVSSALTFAIQIFFVTMLLCSVRECTSSSHARSTIRQFEMWIGSGRDAPEMFGFWK
ncbi:hypothetical protein FB446DRAFT_727837 [Lentinula raphanica]|nr:hypothetical protein FB446DRAFT_727837 [Lentinula raphanica]